MTALFIVLGVLTVLLCIPVGIRAEYDEEPAVYLTVLGIPIRLYPAKEGKKQKEADKPEAKERKKFNLPPKAQLEEYLRLLLEVLGRFRRRLRVNRLMLHACFGGNDPADAALNYGRAWAAIGVVMPLLEQCFVIRHRDVGAFVEEGEKAVRLVARLHATLTVGRFLHLALLALWRFIKIYKPNQTGKAV